jgi:ABC-type phosphate transport system ATPase subunit
MELPIKMKLKSALLLLQVALWDEVKDKLKNQLLNFLEVNNNGYVLPVLAIKPSILLMDEPTSALDPFPLQN